MTVSIQLKVVVSVSEMARMLGMSRSRLYQLVKAGVLPQSVYDVRTRRPIYTEEQQRVCLEVRRRNFGINGKPILFYSRRIQTAAPIHVNRRSRTKPGAPSTNGRHSGLVEALKSLGLDATPARVQSAVASLYPDGHEGVDEGVLIRAVFRHLRQSVRQNTADNVGR